MRGNIKCNQSWANANLIPAEGLSPPERDLLRAVDEVTRRVIKVFCFWLGTTAYHRFSGGTRMSMLDSLLTALASPLLLAAAPKKKTAKKAAKKATKKAAKKSAKKTVKRAPKVAPPPAPAAPETVAEMPPAPEPQM